MHHDLKPAAGLKLSSVSKESCFMPVLQKAISHRLLMTWLAFVELLPGGTRITGACLIDAVLTEIFCISRPKKAHYLEVEFAFTAAFEADASCYSGILQMLKYLQKKCYLPVRLTHWNEKALSIFCPTKNCDHIVHCFSLAKPGKRRVHVSAAL